MGKSSPGLVITLIVFIVLTLALGVVSYFMGKGYNEMSQKFKEAGEKATKAEGEFRSLSASLDKIKEKVGYPGVEGDQLLQNMDADIKNAFGEGGDIPKTYKETVVSLAESLKNKNEELKSAQVQRDEYKVSSEGEQAKSRAQKEEFDKKVADLSKEAADRDAQATARYEELNNSKLTLVKELETVKKEAKELNEQYRVKAADADETSGLIAGINVSLRDKLTQLEKADFDVPDGKIVYVDPDNRLVRIDLGSGDDLRLLTTFGVYPSDSMKLGVLRPKGSVEITRILGEHESEGRILTDEMNDPFIPGDLLYTPLWKTGDKIQVALDYFLDIDKDGQSDLDQLVNMVQTTGASVAAWLDENGDIHGEITPDITFLITGNESIVDLLKDNNTLSDDQKAKIQKTHMDLIELARKNSVREIKLDEFLRRIQYKSTAIVSRYQEPGGVDNPVSNANNETVSKAYVAPIYRPGEKQKAPVSRGLTAPIYGTQKGRVVDSSPGKVSDYYFRPRKPVGK